VTRYDEAMSLIGSVQKDRFRERWFAKDSGLLTFAWEAVMTKDEHDGRLKPLPDQYYLRDFFRSFLAYDMLFVLKSRQIMITWASFIALVWSCLRRRYCATALIPKTDKDGEQHIEDRVCSVLWPSLPKWLRDDFQRSASEKTFQLTHRRGIGRWDSWITSFAKGEDQLRSYTHSILYWDEMAFQPLARKSYRGAMATIGGRKGLRGKVLAVSSLNPNSFHDEMMGGTRLVDPAVAVALNQRPCFTTSLAPIEQIDSPAEGIAHYFYPKYGSHCIVYSFLADTVKRNPTWEVQESLRYGGIDSPDWQIEFRMNRQAYHGVVVYPHFNEKWNVIEPRDVNRECEIFLSFDHGHTNPTAVLFWEYDQMRNQLTCFDEIYITKTLPAAMKPLIAQKLALHLKCPLEDVIFTECLGHNVSDPRHNDTIAEYAQEPNPLHLVGNLPEARWKVNDVQAGEARLDGSFRPSFLCCGIRQFPPDGEFVGTCQVRKGDVTCGSVHEAHPMLVIMRDRAPNFVEEIPRQQRMAPMDPTLETPEKSMKYPAHAVDSARYAVMRTPDFLMAADKIAIRPTYLIKPVNKLTALEQFWKERYDLAEKAELRKDDMEAEGEIGYPDDVGDELDVW
jgi:hypothetical protein